SVQGSGATKRRMYLVLWMVTTAPLTRSTSGATDPGSTPVPAAPGGGTAAAGAETRRAAAATARTRNDRRAEVGRTSMSTTAFARSASVPSIQHLRRTGCRSDDHGPRRAEGR